MDILPGLRVVVFASTWLNKNHRGKYTTPLLGTVTKASSNRITVKPDSDFFSRKRLYEREFWFNEAWVYDYWERGHYVDMQVYKEINPPAPPSEDNELRGMVSDLEKRVKLLEKKFTILHNHTSNTYAIGAVDIKPEDL